MDNSVAWLVESERDRKPCGSHELLLKSSLFGLDILPCRRDSNPSFWHNAGPRHGGTDCYLNSMTLILLMSPPRQVFIQTPVTPVSATSYEAGQKTFKVATLSFLRRNVVKCHTNLHFILCPGKHSKWCFKLNENSHKMRRKGLIRHH
jgi:hypothetical protein